MKPRAAYVGVCTYILGKKIICRFVLQTIILFYKFTVPHMEE